ncbi:hypothetical protein GCM10020331_098160 [Ectobacillus funiculus]
MGQQTKYNMVKETRKEWITSGGMKPEEKIYSENELVKKWPMSADTLFVKLQVTGDLVHQGWLYREQGTAQGCYSVATANKKREGNPLSITHDICYA